MKQEWFPSRWGPNDEVGALNEISSSKLIQAANLVKIGKVYILAHTLEYGIPQDWFHGQFIYSTFRRHEDSLKLFMAKNNVGSMNLRFEMADHTGTHIDGINHTSIDGKLYNGHLAKKITGTFGTSRLGIEKTPSIFTKGILIDLPLFKKVKRLRPGYVISANEMKAVLKLQKVKLRRGDAVLIGTGWSQLWMFWITRNIWDLLQE